MLKKSSKFKQAFELNLYLQSQINFKKNKTISYCTIMLES